MKWIQLKLETTNEAIEAISYMLTEIGISGIEIEDNMPLSEEDKKLMYVDILEEPINTLNDNAYIKFYISEQDDVEGKLEKIREGLVEISEFLPVGTGTITRTETEEKDWADNWKKYFKPFRVDDNIIIKPSWEQLEDYNEDDIIIEIDPGMAFGTGTHETTSLCIHLLNKNLKKDSIVYDVGCGSGILGIAASKLGAKEVHCIDIDVNAVTVAKENVIINNVEHNVKVMQGDLLETVTGKADLIVANILADIIIMLTKDVRKFIKEDGLFISSGIILEKVDSVVEALNNNGFKVVEIMKKGEWAAIVAACTE